MEKQDARKLKKEAQQMLRNQVIRLCNAGKTYSEIGEIPGMHDSRACQIYKAYERDGKKAFTIKQRGRTKERRGQILLMGRGPEQLINAKLSQVLPLSN